MAIFNFKKNVKIYIVQDGIQYRAEVSDINFSQTFTENSYEVKTLHNQGNLFEASTINKANPANFDFSLNLLKENDLQYIVNLAIDYETNTKTIQTFDLYIDTKASLFKIEGCAITNTSFNIERNSLLSLDISGQGSKLTQIDRWDVNSWNDPPNSIGTWVDLGSGRYQIDGTQTANQQLSTYSVARHGVDYLVTYEIEASSGVGNVYAKVGGYTIPEGLNYNTVVGTYSEILYVPVGSGNNGLQLFANIDFVGIVKNISFQPLNIPGTALAINTTTYLPLRYLNIILNRLELQKVDINTINYWTVFGTNTIVQDGDEVKITYVSNINGGNLNLASTGALNIDLVPGTEYTITGSARINAVPDLADITTNATITDTVTISSVDKTVFSLNFTADATTALMHLDKLWIAEIMWISDVRIYETATGDTISDSVFNVSIELQNNIEWIPYTTINEALDTTDATNSMYPSQFVLKNRILAGSIGIYLRDDNVNYLQNWDSDIPLRIQVGEDSGGIIYGLDFNMPACTLTNRLGVDSVFTQSYDWRMTHNPSDLSDVITYVTL